MDTKQSLKAVDHVQMEEHKPSYGVSGVRQMHSLISLAITLCNKKIIRKTQKK